MNKITITLTQDQAKFIDTLLQDYIIRNPVRQGQQRIAFAQRISTKLTGKDYTIDHSSAENIINAKLATGELPSVN